MQPIPTPGEAELAELLAGDTDGRHRAAIVARLEGLRDACAGARRQLNDRERFRQIQAASAAVDAALVALDLVTGEADAEAGNFLLDRGTRRPGAPLS